MNIISKLKNHRLRFREKFSNSYSAQLLRWGGLLIRSPYQGIRNGFLKVIIGLTYECQCNCEYCCSGLYIKNKEKEISTSEVKSLLDDIGRLPFSGIVVTFFGGEALMRNDIFELVKYTNRRGLFAEIETNGILLSLDNVKRLKKAGLHHVFLRIENTEPESHDRISDFKGCFSHAVYGIGHCVEEGLSCSISTIATKEKIYNGQIKEIIKLGKELRVSSVRILYPTCAGRWIKNEHEVLTETEENAVKEFLTPDFVYLESSYVCAREMDRICPSKDKKMFYVSCYGEVQPCPFVPINFGNIREKGLNEILDNMWKKSIFGNENYRGCLMNNRRFHDKYVRHAGPDILFAEDIERG